MATPITSTKYRLRAGSPMPKNPGGSCPPSAPTSYVIQSFGVDVTEVDNYDSIIGLYASEVMAGLQNFEDTEAYRDSAFSRISYTGTNTRDTDGAAVWRGTEEHVAAWVDEETAGLVWLS